MRFRFFWACLFFLAASLLNAQENKRALRPISFRVMNVEPTTFITYEPFKISYRLEYLRPSKGKEVRILDDLDKNHFQNALGTPVDVDLRELKKKFGDKINALKLDSGPQIKVSDLWVGQEEIVGDKIRRDFIVTLKLIRETTTAAPIPNIRLEIPEVSVAWAVVELGQKEGEYQHEEPVKSAKVLVNHVLTTPTHDPNLNFRSRIFVPGYSSPSIYWFFWGIPTVALLLVGALFLVLVKLYRQPVYVVEDKAGPMAEVKRHEEVSGIKRMKFNYARAELWEAANAAVQASDSQNQENHDELFEKLYRSLNNLLLAALPSAPMGALPADFIRILAENKHRSKMENTIYALANLTNSLRLFYEAMNVGKDTKEAFGYYQLIRSTLTQTRKLWWYNRIFRSEK